MERRWLVYPYHLWMLLFTVAPLALIFFFAFTNQGSWTFTLDNIRQAAEPLYLRVLGHSVWLAALATFLCFLINSAGDDPRPVAGEVPPHDDDADHRSDVDEFSSADLLVDDPAGKERAH